MEDLAFVFPAPTEVLDSPKHPFITRPSFRVQAQGVVAQPSSPIVEVERSNSWTQGSRCSPLSHPTTSCCSHQYDRE